MNRKVLVIGATAGIGKAIAMAFAAEKDQILLCGRRDSALAEVKAEIEAAHKVPVSTVTLDVRDRQTVETLIPQAIKDFGGIDILVNNAGLAQGLDDFQNSSLDDADTMMDINVKGLIYVSRTVLPFMVEQNSGHVLNIGSTAGAGAYAKGAVYCASKAAVKTISDGIEALQAEDIANAVVYCTNQPRRVQISDITVMVKQQATNNMKHKVTK